MGNWVSAHIGFKTAGLVGAAAFLGTCVVHVLVIVGVIPFHWVGGGRLTTLESARMTSVLSIVILLLFAFVSLWGGRFVLKRWQGKYLSIILWLIFGYLCVNFVLNLLGSPFEKTVMNLLCVPAGLSLFRLALGTAPGK